LVKSSGLSGDERRQLIRLIAERLEQAKGPVHFLMPLQGVEEWDKPGEPAYDPDALDAMIDEVRKSITVPKSEVDAHINDQAYADAVLAIVDGWIADGTLSMSVSSAA